MDASAVPHLGVILVIIVVALGFDFINGFHDAANSIATIVSTRVLSPGHAVLWAAFFNFVAAFGFGTHVAKTVGKGMVDPMGITVYVILAGVLGAIAWDLLTWWWGLPTSSSHALIGGFGGAAVVHAGWGVLILGGFQKTILFIFVAPILGMVLAFALMVAVMWIFRKAPPRSVDGVFRVGQLFSAALYSLSHGANDAQKTMGIIVALLISGDLSAWAYQANGKEIAWWIILSCHAAIALGTISGGWRIVKTMGQKITKLKPVGGFCAETGGATSIFMATFLGIPVSTTHVITGAIVGVGATHSKGAVRWGVAGRIVWAWFLTIPASAMIAAVFQYLFESMGLG
jgi:PiT family inorganic phosphate transporter